MTGHLEYLASVERTEQRAKVRREFTAIVAAVDRGTLSPAVAIIKIAAIEVLYQSRRK